jgi:hypothetical protein
MVFLELGGFSMGFLDFYRKTKSLRIAGKTKKLTENSAQTYKILKNQEGFGQCCWQKAKKGG